MQTQWIVATCFAIIAFFILQNIDDARAQRNNQPKANLSKKALLFLFLLLISLVLFHLLESSTGFFSAPQLEIPKILSQNVATNIEPYPKIDAHTIEKNMLRAIREDVDIGRVPF